MVSFTKLVLLSVATIALTCSPVAHASQDLVQVAPRHLRHALRQTDNRPPQSGDIEAIPNVRSSVDATSTDHSNDIVAKVKPPAGLGATTTAETRSGLGTMFSGVVSQAKTGLTDAGATLNAAEDKAKEGLVNAGAKLYELAEQAKDGLTDAGAKLGTAVDTVKNTFRVKTSGTSAMVLDNEDTAV